MTSSLCFLTFQFFRLNATSTANVLKYFKMFKIYVPEEKVTKPHDPLEAGLLLLKNIFMTKLVSEL